MKHWIVLVAAEISDEVEVEAETEQEAEEIALKAWSFTEAIDLRADEVRES